jgi:hypothetical protein
MALLISSISLDAESRRCKGSVKAVGADWERGCQPLILTGTDSPISSARKASFAPDTINPSCGNYRTQERT